MLTSMRRPLHFQYARWALGVLQGQAQLLRLTRPFRLLELGSLAARTRGLLRTLWRVLAGAQTGLKAICLNPLGMLNRPAPFQNRSYFLLGPWAPPHIYDHAVSN